jgi:glycosyltransferase involved in cell wall biosynthesis
VSYAVVTPARNEAGALPTLAESLAAQSLRPVRWNVVENGSTDETPQVLQALTHQVPFLEVHEMKATGRPVRGAHIVRAFESALPTLDPLPDVVVKVDADITFPEDHFEQLMARFARDERLGIASGTCYERVDDAWVERHVTGDHVWGAARAYRRDVLPVVMPLEARMGWDGIDQIKANIAGWRTATFKDLPFFHHRPEGVRDGAAFRARVNQGRASYYMGYRPTYLLLRSAFAVRRDRAALGLVWGYALEAASRRPRCPDPSVRQYVRSQQSAGHWRRRLDEARGYRRTGAAP